MCSARLCWAGEDKWTVGVRTTFYLNFLSKLLQVSAKPGLVTQHHHSYTCTLVLGTRVDTRVPRDHTQLLVLAYICHLSCGDGTGGAAAVLTQIHSQ